MLAEDTECVALDCGVIVDAGSSKLQRRDPQHLRFESRLLSRFHLLQSAYALPESSLGTAC